MSEQRWVTTDYRVTADGGLTHKRWLNSDGTRKTGVELEKEKMRVELESISRRLIVLCPDDFDAFMAILDNPPEPNEKLKRLMRNEPICNFCGLPTRLGGGAINEVAGHRQTFCCGQPLETCCDGAPTG